MTRNNSNATIQCKNIYEQIKSKNQLKILFPITSVTFKLENHTHGIQKKIADKKF